MVGILPGSDRREANEWVRLALPTGMGELRNGLIVRAADAVVAVGGAYGTLSEIALALTRRRRRRGLRHLGDRGRGAGRHAGRRGGAGAGARRRRRGRLTVARHVDSTGSAADLQARLPDPRRRPRAHRRAPRAAARAGRVASAAPRASSCSRATTATPDNAAAALDAMTLTLGRRFIIVDGVERWKDKELDALVASLGAVPPETTIAFFAREESRTKAPERLHAAVRDAGGDVSAEVSVKPWELPKWVTAHAAGARGGARARRRPGAHPPRRRPPAAAAARAREARARRR